MAKALVPARDDFSAAVKKAAAGRVGYFCSNPECRQLTVGPHVEPMKTVSIGVAAHMAAAAPGGPRYDPNQSPEERAAIGNAIWLCQSCSRLIDMDEQAYTCQLLVQWRHDAEAAVRQALEGRRGNGDLPIGSFRDLCRAILRLLEENHMIFAGYGPNSGAADEGPVRYDLGLWYKAREERIRPNNRRIVELLESHDNLIPLDAKPHVAAFKLHARAFDAHCDDATVKYSDHRFPRAFADTIKQHAGA